MACFIYFLEIFLKTLKLNTFTKFESSNPMLGCCLVFFQGFKILPSTMMLKSFQLLIIFIFYHFFEKFLHILNLKKFNVI